MNVTIDLTSVPFEDLATIPTIDELIAWAKGCTGCGLAQERDQVVPPWGNTKSPLLLVGMNPGQLENFTGVPFTGRQEVQESRCVSCEHYTDCYNWQTGGGARGPLVKNCRGHKQKTGPDHLVPTSVKAGPYTLGGIISAGQILDDMLVHLGVDRKALFFTNSALCKAAVGEPKPQYVNTCAQIRLHTQALTKPKVILALGKLAINQYTGKNAALKAIHGIPIPMKDFILVPTYHPAAILRTMLEMPRMDLSARNDAEVRIKDEKTALMNDFLTAVNLLDENEIAEIAPGKTFTNGKLVR